MNTLTKLSSILFGLIAVPALLLAQSSSHGADKPIPKEVLPIVKHTKVLSLNEIATTDFTGNYSGQRFQYTENKKAILRTYSYVMNVVQKGNTVSGTTTITSDNGDFAVIKLRGMVMDDKLYFEEYEIQDQKKSDDAVWCFKIGELQMGKHNQQTVIYGPTNSYTSTYYSPCSGGYTMLEKVNEETSTSNVVKKQIDQNVTTIIDNNPFALHLYPNPFVNESNLLYTTAKESKIKIELYDINGALISTLANEIQGSGSHSITVNGNNLTAGVYILKINIDGMITSKQIIKTTN
jgi:Secretion system C-terminal sorting domain